jgi:hypothetical protein
MSGEMVKLDQSGKIILDHIYNERDPRPYFSTLQEFDYSIPGEAAPVFRRVIEALRAGEESESVNLIDLGCSYGVNAAILKHGLSMDALYDRYTGGAAAGLDHDTLIARDRDFYGDHLADPGLEITGFDVAENAIDYAVETRMLDNGVATNLETGPMPEAVAGSVAETDLVISTGCIGYVKQPTLSKIIEAGDGKAPWMAHFVLRMFPFDEFEDLFAEHGYVTEKLPGTYRQRRFASPEEAARVLDNLAALGIDPSGVEAEGWYHAEFHLSRPAQDAEAAPLDRLFGH